MSFGEQARAGGALHGSGWRSLRPPQTVRCYVGSTWIDAPATEVNDETREVRIEHQVVTRGLRRFILDASQYRPVSGLFRRGEGPPLGLLAGGACGLPAT